LYGGRVTEQRGFVDNNNIMKADRRNNIEALLKFGAGEGR